MVKKMVIKMVLPMQSRVCSSLKINAGYIQSKNTIRESHQLFSLRSRGLFGFLSTCKSFNGLQVNGGGGV